MHFFRSFTSRIILSHILVATFTSVAVSLFWLVVINVALTRELEASKEEYYLDLGHYLGGEWFYGYPSGTFAAYDYPDGFGLVVDPENTVVYIQGDTPCAVGMMLNECAPEWVDHPVGSHVIEHDGQEWGEVVIESVLGHRIITRRAELDLTVEPLLNYGYLTEAGEIQIVGAIPTLTLETLIRAVFSIPIALILSWFFLRPSMRRLSKITQTSAQFAAGEFDVRVNDTHRDEIGILAQQFDDMALVLEQNIHALRELARRNADLAQKAEESATKAERMRLARDIHDSVAQHLFSLSMSTAALPKLIEQNQDAGIERAQQIAKLARQTQLDLRQLLVKMRPSQIIEHGLAESIQGLCEQHQNLYHVPIECSIMLTGQHIPTPVEDVLYRVAEESLSNIAKHARASLVQVSVLQAPQQVILSVTDNGTGFDITTISQTGKFGLIGMRERAQSLGGKLHIESRIQQGTTLQLVLPLAKKEIP